jgi:predicted CoA-binding protein
MGIVNKKTIEDFYAVKRLAVIGVSRDKHDYSRSFYSEMLRRGYDVAPVNPNLESVDGRKCYASVKDITPAVDHAVALLPPEKTEHALTECAAAGVKTIWLHQQHIGQGVTNTRAIYICEEKGIKLITGFCPFMFMPKTAFPHRLHGAILKLIGAYPK